MALRVKKKSYDTFLDRRRKRKSAHISGVWIVSIKYNVGGADHWVEGTLAMRLMKQMIAPAEVSRSWMSVADDSVLYTSGAKFPRSIVIYRVSGLCRGRLDRVANSFVRCLVYDM